MWIPPEHTHTHTDAHTEWTCCTWTHIKAFVSLDLSIFFSFFSSFFQFTQKHTCTHTSKPTQFRSVIMRPSWWGKHRVNREPFIAQSRGVSSSLCVELAPVCVCVAARQGGPQRRGLHGMTSARDFPPPGPGTQMYTHEHTHTHRYIECSQHSWQHQSNQSLPYLLVTSSDDFL